MAAIENPSTTVSTKGQIILPSAIRQRPEDVFGMLGYKGKPKSLEEMDAGVLAEAKRRHARD